MIVIIIVIAAAYPCKILWELAVHDGVDHDGLDVHQHELDHLHVGHKHLDWLGHLDSQQRTLKHHSEYKTK
jgi:hypothetical protein